MAPISQLCLLATALATAQSFTVSDENSLRTTLFSNYQKDIRPTTTVDMSVSLQLTSIITLDMVAESLSISGWWVFEWTDSRLTWTPGSYDGIEVLLCKDDDIWTPVLVVSNSITDLSAIDEDTIPLRVGYDGEVNWRPAGIIVTGCDVDSTYFPFDKQVCNLEVTSFGYSLQEVNLTSDDGVLLSYYTTNGEWDLMSASTTASVYTDDDGLEYDKLSFSLTLRRRAGFYWLNVMFPIMLNGLLCIFNFLLPAESGERMGYSLTLVLTFVVLMTLTSSSIPTSAEHTSLLEVYICLILVLSAVAVILAITNLNVYFMDEDRPVPLWAQNFTRGCMRFCRYRKVKHYDAGATQGKSSWSVKEEGEKTQQAEINHEITGHTAVNNNKLHHNQTPVEAMSKKSTNQRHVHDSNSDITWKLMAAMMDTVFLRLYLILVFVLTVVFLAVLQTGH